MTDRRRPRGTMEHPVTPGWKIERASKERIDEIAQRAGISSSYLVELLAEHVELTDQGIPTWLPPLNRDGELPIDPD
jgi:hypothetical protein